MTLRSILILGCTLCLLSACSTFKSITGQQDDSVLPGQREEVLPPEQQTARDPIITGQQPQQADPNTSQKPCDPNLPDCLSPVDPIDQDAPGQ